MAKTVNEGFLEFHRKLSTTPVQSAAAASHRESISSCLKTNYEMTRFFRTGSFGNGTNISGHSDVDYFAEIPTRNLKRSSSLSLTMIRETLDTRFPRTGVHVDCPAVVVPFGTDASETTEVVPGDYSSQSDKGYRIYEIADGAGGWMKASPDSHTDYVREHHSRLSDKLKPLIRFIKAWKYYRNVPISSFYLELRVTKLLEDDTSIIYSYDVLSVFKHLSKVDLAAIRDPMGISGLIPACSSDAKLEDAKSKLATALSRAEKAREAEKSEKIADAFSYWGLLYNSEFPSYT